MVSQNWDWYNEENAEDIVIPQMDAVAVYENAGGDIVIRQKSSLGEDDQIVVIPKSFSERLIEAIKAVI